MIQCRDNVYILYVNREYMHVLINYNAFSKKIVEYIA